MKDIEQSLLVARAVEDLLIDCDIRHVPCVRDTQTAVPVSSRLRFLPPERLQEVGAVYHALELGRLAILAGQTKSATILAEIRERLEPQLSTFKIAYLTLVDADDFGPIDEARLPFILHCAITDGTLNHFDGLCIRTDEELQNSPAVIWI